MIGLAGLCGGFGDVPSGWNVRCWTQASSGSFRLCQGSYTPPENNVFPNTLIYCRSFNFSISWFSLSLLRMHVKLHLQNNPRQNMFHHYGLIVLLSWALKAHRDVVQPVLTSYVPASVLVMVITEKSPSRSPLASMDTWPAIPAGHTYRRGPSQ